VAGARGRDSRGSTPLLYNRDAERAVLGSCLLGRLEVVTKTRAVLPADAFYVARHAMIWRAVCALADDGIAADPLTVDIRAKELGERWSDGEDRLYLAELLAAAPLGHNPMHVAEVARWARLRRVWETGTRLAQQATAVADAGVDLGGRLESLLAEAQSRLSDLAAPAAEEPGSWRPVDIEPILTGTFTTPQPTVGRRSDDRAFLYPGRVHTAAGESESGKTWFATALGVAEMDAGRRVVHLDFEDDSVGVVGRYMAAGASREQLRDQFAYVRPYDPLTVLSGRSDLETLLAQLAPSLVTVDGVTEAMSLHDLDPLKNVDAAQFGAILLRWLARRGPAVLALDHVTKARDERGRYALGAVHKLNAVDGAAFIVEQRRPFGIGLTGRSTIYLAKDRPGQLRQNARPASAGLYWYSDLVVKSHDVSFVEIDLAAPPDKPVEFRPTVLMTKAYEALKRANNPLSQSEIVTRVGGKRAVEVRRAIAFLVDEGYFTTKPGPYRSVLHEIAKPFEPDGAQLELPDEGAADEPAEPA
jgi:hypothetical protein